MPTERQNIDLRSFSVIDLLNIHSGLLDELKKRGIVRTRNNPVSGYSEWLVAKKLGLQLEDNSNAGYDAIDSKGLKYEIKGRRITPTNKSTQLSAIRNLKEKHFDYLIGVIFDKDYNILYAAQIPHKVVVEYSSYRVHTNSYVFHLRKSILADKRMKDITKKLTP